MSSSQSASQKEDGMTLACLTACPPIRKRYRSQRCLLDGPRPRNSMDREALLFLPTDGAEMERSRGTAPLPAK
jgi:hypothetical protein